MTGPSGRGLLLALATDPTVEQLVTGVGALDSAAYSWARHYVAGRTVEDALHVARGLHAEGFATSLDQFGEHLRVPGEAVAVRVRYERLARGLEDLGGDAWLSIDLSHLGLDVDPDLCLRQLEHVWTALPPGRRLQVGAEDASRADAILDVVLRAAAMGAPLTATVQANLRRSEADADRLAEADVPIRLVKGAYVEPPDVAHPFGEATDLAYLRLAHRLHRNGAALSLATHDAVLREALLAAFGPTDVEVLLGVRTDDARALIARGVPVRVYVPFGERWFRYAMRRLAESAGTR